MSPDIKGGEQVQERYDPQSSSSYPFPPKHLNDPISPSTDDPPPVLAPNYIADPFASHESMGCDFLGTTSLFQAPEAETRVVACGDKFPAVRGEGKGCDCGRVSEHGVSALTCLLYSHWREFNSTSGYMEEREEGKTRTYRYWHQRTAPSDLHAH